MQRGIVWVVDDDSSIRWVLERALTGAGLTCTTFEGGKEVLDALATKTPDVLMSDIRMPGMDGLDFAERAHEMYPDTVIVILTGYDSFAYAQKAISIGVKEYLLKPIDYDELKNMAARLAEEIRAKKEEQQEVRD